MATLLLIIHVLILIALIATVLLQRSEGGGLGIGGGGMMSTRGSGNALTKATAFLAAGFFITSITLTIMARTSTTEESKIDNIKVEGKQDAGTPPAPPKPEEAKQPETPVVPKPE